MGRSKVVFSKLSVEDQLKERAAEYEVLSTTYHSARFGTRPGQYDVEEARALVNDILATLLDEPMHGRKLLDVACGSGKITVAMGQSGARVVGIDAAMGMLRKCSANFSEAVESNVMLTNASAANLPYADNSFDMVFSSRFLHLFSPKGYSDLIREMVRVVKPGGYVVVEMKNRWYGIALYHIKDVWRRIKGENIPSSYMSVGQIRSLEQQVGGISLQSIPGLLLPKGWWFMGYPRLRRSLRALSRGALRSVSGHLVAIYRKNQPA